MIFRELQKQQKIYLSEGKQKWKKQEIKISMNKIEIPETNEEYINYNTIKNRFKTHKLDIKYNPIIFEIRELNKTILPENKVNTRKMNLLSEEISKMKNKPVD